MNSIDSAILSRPRYGTLAPCNAPAHLFIADDAGADAIMALAGLVDADYFASAEIIYIDTRQVDNARRREQLASLKCPRLYIGPSFDAASQRLKRSMEQMHMGTQVYLAGSENLLSLATQAVMEAGLDYQAVQTEHRGSRARRVQCVHCKGITENVTTQPVECAHCGLLLLVRDHYSRRIGAYQGVNINAEDPTEIPAREEVFL